LVIKQSAAESAMYYSVTDILGSGEMQNKSADVGQLN